jgi:hypothetical protein
LTKAVLSHLAALRLVHQNKPIPLAYWSALRSVLRYVTQADDPLFPPGEFTKGTSLSLKARELQDLLSNDVLGLWSLDTRTIDFLWHWMLVNRPQITIECGAGVSTLVLATYLGLLGQSRDCGVFSVEQDLSTKNEVEGRLVKSGMSDRVQILYAPLGREPRYEIDTANLSGLLRSRKADLLLIDGPSGPSGCRVWTLPLLAPFCRPGATWFLDDAFRDGELRVLNTWSRLPGVSVVGIYPIGKGFARGVITDTRRVSLETLSDATRNRSAQHYPAQGSIQSSNRTA